MDTICTNNKIAEKHYKIKLINACNIYKIKRKILMYINIEP